MFWIIGFAILFVALLIPILAIVLDSPALKHLFESRRPMAPPEVSDLSRKVAILEDQVDDLSRSLETLKEEQQFLHQLLENPERPRSRQLPPK